MASLSLRDKCMNFVKDDEWMTPKHVFEHISHLIPKDLTIWECFFGDGKSGEYLREMGFNVIHEPIDFFEENRGEILISNPPYSIKSKVFRRLREIGKPFMMLVPVSTITKKFLTDLFRDEVQLVIPKKRIHFIKKGQQSDRAWFDTVWLCHGMEFERDITFL